MYHPLSAHFPHWSRPDIEEHCEIVKGLGETAWRERIPRVEAMADRVAMPDSTPESYDAYRVDTFGCVSCLNSIRRRWSDMKNDPFKGVRADRATGEYVFGGSW